MSSTERSLVLGAYSNLPAHDLEPFVGSLRRSGFRGSFAVVAGRLQQEDRAALGELADDVMDVDAEYAGGLRLARALLARMRSRRVIRRAYSPLFGVVSRGLTGHPSPARWSSLEYHLEGLQALRYAHYLRYLLERAPHADLVMVSDLRDVVFQRDPFADPVDGLELFLEDESVRIGADVFNTRWIANLYGAGELDELRGRTVSCSGTVVGTRDAMLEYLAEMTQEIARHRGRPLGCHDQAIHNVLFNRGGLPNTRVVGNATGRILTMGMMSDFREAPDGSILNDDGTTPAALHQWDRHGRLALRLARRVEITDEGAV
jgi:hypothetical protein